MKKKMLLVLGAIILVFLAFFHKGVQNAVFVNEPETQMQFDQAKWLEQKGWGYAYRNQMLNDVISDPEIRALNQDEIINLLGVPSRTNENYMYYTIDQKRAIILPLHTKSLVIKFDQDTIEWMKIHE